MFKTLILCRHSSSWCKVVGWRNLQWIERGCQVRFATKYVHKFDFQLPDVRSAWQLASVALISTETFPRQTFKLRCLKNRYFLAHICCQMHNDHSKTTRWRLPVSLENLCFFTSETPTRKWCRSLNDLLISKLTIFSSINFVPLWSTSQAPLLCNPLLHWKSWASGEISAVGLLHWTHRILVERQIRKRGTEDPRRGRHSPGQAVGWNWCPLHVPQHQGLQAAPTYQRLLDREVCYISAEILHLSGENKNSVLILVPTLSQKSFLHKLMGGHEKTQYFSILTFQKLKQQGWACWHKTEILGFLNTL